MGAYDNPAIIRDRSAEIYGQAAASFGSAIGKGIMNYSQSKAQQRKEADEQNLKDRNIFLEIELAYEKDYQENLNLAKKSETPMLDSFEKSAKNLLNGTKDAIGAKQARYELMTKKNLNEKEKEERLKIVNNYQTFMGDAKFNMGSMMAEKEEYFNFTRSDLNRKFSFKGSGIERTRNMFTYLALNNNSAPEGVTYEKRLYAGPNGENMVYAKTTFDENSATFKNLSKFDQDEIRKNGMSLVFDQNWNDWRKEGFLTEILQGLDPEKMQESIKFKDDSGGLTADFSTNLSLQVRSEGGKDITSQQNIVNTPLLLENLYEPASNRASVVMDATPQEQDDYIAFTLGRKGSDFDRNKTKIGPNGETFQEMLNSGAAMEFITKETQELFLEDNLTRGFGKDKRGYVKRKATKQQAAALNRLNKNIEGFDGSDIQEGDDVYVKDTDINIVKSDRTDSRGNDFTTSAKYNVDKVVEVIEKKDPKFFRGKKIAGKTVSDASIDPATGNLLLYYDKTVTKNGKTEVDLIPIPGYDTVNFNNRSELTNLLEQLIARGGDPTKDEIKEINAMKEYLKTFQFPGEQYIGMGVRTDVDTRPVIFDGTN